MAGARRALSDFCAAFARRAWLGLCVWLALGPAGAGAQDLAGRLLEARFLDPTERYAHGVLGDAVEWGGLALTMSADKDGAKPVTVVYTLPPDHVFEDLAPRLVDLDLDGWPDAAMVVETDMALGAALALYDAGGKIAETPHIGRGFRWLAPLGAADLDGDGQVELAYIDRPHLAKTLRIWRFRKGRLEPVAQASGLTNHRIGEDFISGGIRDCGNDGPEMITADAAWSRIVASRLRNGRISSRAVGVFTGRASFQGPMACQ